VTDWGILVTGLVGVAGIGGTVLATWMTGKSQTTNLRISIGAENERARLAEKRQIYVRYLAASGELINAMAKQHALGEEADDALSTALVYERGAAFTSVLNTLGELLLIAPKHVMLLADSAGATIGGVSPDAGEFRRVREALLLAMRADLGEPVTPAGSPVAQIGRFLKPGTDHAAGAGTTASAMENGVDQRQDA
jgi:hypothetical protein